MINKQSAMWKTINHNGKQPVSVIIDTGSVCSIVKRVLHLSIIDKCKEAKWVTRRTRNEPAEALGTQIAPVESNNWGKYTFRGSAEWTTTNNWTRSVRQIGNIRQKTISYCQIS